MHATNYQKKNPMGFANLLDSPEREKRSEEEKNTLLSLSSLLG